MATRKRKKARETEPVPGSTSSPAAREPEPAIKSVGQESVEPRVLALDELKHLSGGTAPTIRIRIRDNDLTDAG